MDATPAPADSETMLGRLFDQFDVRGTGRLGEQAFKHFQAAVLVIPAVASDVKHQPWTWLAQCKALQTTVERGVDRPAFALLYDRPSIAGWAGQVRTGNLCVDYARAVGA